MKNKLRIAVLLLFASTALSLFSFQLIPITADFTPSGPGSIKNFKVLNNTAETIAVQISMHSRSTEVDGLERNEPADHFFTVYPTQIILKPHDEQIVRVQWKGDGVIQKELPFRIIAEQLPVNFSTDGSESNGLKIMFRYIGSVYVGTAMMEPRVNVEAITIKDDKLALLLHNKGEAHAILQNMSLTITDNLGNNLTTLTGAALKGVEGENILAGEKRNYIIPKPPELTDGVLNAVISYQNP